MFHNVRTWADETVNVNYIFRCPALALEPLFGRIDNAKCDNQTDDQVSVL
jgi:hypothetical protein